MELVDVGNRLINDCLSIVFAQFYRQVFLFNRVEESADL